jgi:hypothetical protein
MGMLWTTGVEMVEMRRKMKDMRSRTDNGVAGRSMATAWP